MVSGCPIASTSGVLSEVAPVVSTSSCWDTITSLSVSEDVALALQLSTLLDKAAEVVDGHSHSTAPDRASQAKVPPLSSPATTSVTPGAASRLPVEVLEWILELTTQDNQGDDGDFRNFSLVCKTWSIAARRVLFGQMIHVHSTKALKRLRDAITSSPELAIFMRKVDLSSPSDRWDPRRIREYYTRAGGLLRSASNVKEISLLHVALNDMARRKLFGALGALNLTSVSFDSSCWSGGNSHQRPSHNTDGTCPDVEALMLSLCRWEGLRKLALRGYSHYPRIISSAVTPSHTIPRYTLESLELDSTDLSLSSLLWLVGPSSSSLRSLNLSGITGLAPADYDMLLSFCSSSLEELQLSIDQDDFVVSTSSHGTPATTTTSYLDPLVFGQLRKLKSLMFSTDLDCTKEFLEELATLPELSFVSFNCPSLPYGRVLRFLKDCSTSLRDIALDVWGEDESWNSHSRYVVANLCRMKNIDFLMDGDDCEVLMDAWFGVGDESLDLNNLWTDMEALNWPKRGLRNCTEQISPREPRVFDDSDESDSD